MSSIAAVGNIQPGCKAYGKLMGRSTALLATALMLAACGGDFDMGKLTAGAGDIISNSVRLELESEPAGAEAKTSLGPSCRTPCSLSMKHGADFTVTFALDGYQPQTLAVGPTYVRADRPGIAGNNVPAHAEFDPNPARVVLEAIPPPPEPPPGKRNARVAALGKATHIVPTAANLFAATAPGSTPIRKLNAGTAVTLVKREAGWALVAREGKTLGYVATTDLIPIQ